MAKRHGYCREQAPDSHHSAEPAPMRQDNLITTPLTSTEIKEKRKRLWRIAYSLSDPRPINHRPHLGTDTHAWFKWLGGV